MKKFFTPKVTVHAHCDLPCGVYDPAQAKIEALSVKACMEKYAANPDADFRSRSVAIKEERSHQVKEHLWVLWTDYFKAPHFEAYPQLHSLFNEATKLAGAAGTKGTQDLAVADKLIAKIDEIAEIFWAFLLSQKRYGAHLHRYRIQRSSNAHPFRYSARFREFPNRFQLNQ